MGFFWGIHLTWVSKPINMLATEASILTKSLKCCSARGGIVAELALSGSLAPDWSFGLPLFS